MEAFEESGVNLQAKTIHAGLIPERTGYDGNGWGFHYNSTNYLPCERVVVDESSMIDNAIMAKLLEAIEPGTQVIFCGDPDQLPPVGKGRPFLDMIESGAVPHANLTEVFRFAGRIAHACKQINQGKGFTPSDHLDLDSNAGEFGPENLRHIERLHGGQALQTLDGVIEKMQARGFDPIKDLQVIVSRNDKGPVNREIVNERMQKLLNPDGFTMGDCPYRVGDKVMCLKNGVRETYGPGIAGEPQKDGSSVYTANGEGGIVEHVVPKAIYCQFGGRPDQVPAWRLENSGLSGLRDHRSQVSGRRLAGRDLPDR